MSDEPRIEPALSADEWGEQAVDWPGAPKARAEIAPTSETARHRTDERWLRIVAKQGDTWPEVNIAATNLPALIALANAALPDSDPRKITRHTLWIIRKLREDAYIDPQHPGALAFMRETETLVSALESYLPANSA
jgi:hypothetical protein